MKRGWTSILVWVLFILFIVAGAIKFIDPSATSSTQFSKWGYADGVRYVVGAAEIILAILLAVPKTRNYGAWGLIIIMVGAIVTHLLHDPVYVALLPLVIIGLLFGVMQKPKVSKKVKYNHSTIKKAGKKPSKKSKKRSRK